MNKEKALGFLKEQREYRLFGMNEEYPSDFDKWQKNQADTYQRIIDWIEKKEED